MSQNAATYPLAGQKQLWTLLEALLRGERLTVASALSAYGCYALSQRMGDLKTLGWPVHSQRIHAPSGKSVCEYSIYMPNFVRQRPIDFQGAPDLECSR